MSAPDAATGAPERLNRFLARRGVASRRGADQLIAAGVVEVNGVPATVGASIDPGADTVTVHGAAVPLEQHLRTLALNKPAGVVTTRNDPQGRPTVMDLVESVRGLVPVGRLDVDSRGLLLLTTDGELAHRVTHPRYGVTKRYRAAVTTPISPRQLLRLRQGVTLEDGPARAISARRLAGRALELVMGEGRKREVRRLCAAVGLEVIDLCRMAVGPIALGDLSEGESRDLEDSELSALRAAVGLPGPAAVTNPATTRKSGSDSPPGHRPRSRSNAPIRRRPHARSEAPIR